MAIPANLKPALVRYGRRSDVNLKKLEMWHDDALESVAAGNGGQVLSASSNGASFSQSADMTNAEWFAVLSEAIQLIENGINSTSRSYGTIF